jgi:hypothetical protein
MTYPGAENPYISPAAVGPAPAAGPTFKPIDKIEYVRMYQYVFDNPNWMINILLGAVCAIIPLIGPLVMVGYQFEVIGALLATQGARYPDFNFNRFADYLMRGLWPFLVQLVATFVLAPVLFIVFFVPMMIIFGIGAAAGEDAAPVIFTIGMLLLGLIMIPLSALFTLLMLPPLLRAGLAQDFVEGFNLAWAMDFLKKTWPESFLAILFLMFTAGLLGILGMLACYIGLFVMLPVIFLAQAHMYYQLYLLYLSRGGTPVPEKTAAYAPPK